MPSLRTVVAALLEVTAIGIMLPVSWHGYRAFRQALLKDRAAGPNELSRRERRAAHQAAYQPFYRIMLPGGALAWALLAVSAVVGGRSRAEAAEWLFFLVMTTVVAFRGMRASRGRPET